MSSVSKLRLGAAASILVFAAVLLPLICGWLQPWGRQTAAESIVIAAVPLTLLLLAFGLERHHRSAERSERRSRKADSLYRFLAENDGDLIMVKGQSPATESYVSPSSLRIVGWSPEELIALPTEQFVHEDDLARFTEQLAFLTIEQPTSMLQYRVKHKNGHLIWLETAVQLTDHPTMGVCTVFSARDITGRRTSEDALRDSEALYRLLADSSSDLVTRLTLDGVRQYVSPASTEILGFQPDELVGTSLSDTTHPDDLGRIVDALDSLRLGRTEQASSTHRTRHKDGHWVWLDKKLRLVRDKGSNDPAEIVCSARDVTKRKALQEQVAAGAHLLMATLESMDQGLIALSHDGRIEVSNTRANALLELSPADQHSSLISIQIGSDIHKEVRQAVLEAVGSMSMEPMERQLSDGRVLEVRQSPMPEGAALVTVGDITHLKRAEAVAQDANRLLLMAEEVAHVGHWRVDSATQALSWSDEIYRIHGLDPSSFAPDVRTAIDLFHPEDRADVARFVTEALETRGHYEFTRRVVLPDGEVRDVLSRGRSEIDPLSGEVTGLFGVLVDISGHVRAQRDLQAKSEHLEATLDAMEQGLVKVAADGTIELANRRFAELFDIPASLLTQRGLNLSTINNLMASRGVTSTTLVRTIVPQETRTHGLAIGSYELSLPDSRVFDVRIVPLAGGGVVRTFSDITARRQAESAVRASEARYRMLADTTSDVITQLDLDLHRRYVSPACEALLGYEPKQMVGSDIASLIHPEDSRRVLDLAGELISGALPTDRTTTTYRMLHKDGSWVWVEAGINLVRDPDTGKARSLICSLRDVTARQQAARHLERAKNAAENAARQKSEFVANMSHELRTPLTGILGIHDLLQADPTLNERQRRYLDMARSAGHSLLGIVNDVLDFSKIEAGQLTIERSPFDLETLVEACRDLASEAAMRKMLRIDTKVFGAPVTLVGDSARLRQVLLNLLTNAVKFTEQGCVSLEARYCRDTSRLRIEVTDTGIGIPAGKLPSLFGRFNQADTSITRQYGGTGLGLAICKRLVELMGGEIGVTSELGRGSTFWFDLPAVELEAMPGDAWVVADASVPLKLRVLLAEDNLVNQEIIAAMLEQRGHAVTVVDNGAAAAAAARGQAGFDVILMDLQMPVMDGLTATRAIRVSEKSEGRSATPIVGLTANAMVQDVELCLQAGMDAHVAKPIEWADLFAKMDAVMAAHAGNGKQEGATPAKESPAEVLDPSKLDQLAKFVGTDRVGKMLKAFVLEVERLLSGIDQVENQELIKRVHTLVSLSGQFGFSELSRLCAKMEDEARLGADSPRKGELQVSATRAIAEAKSFSFGVAA